MPDHLSLDSEACPCCGTNSWRPVPYTRQIGYRACQACDYHIQVRSDGEDRIEAFLREQDKFYAEDTVVVSPTLTTVTKEITDRRISTIRSRLQPGASLIEAGPGAGDVLLVLTDLGYSTAAAEHSKTLADRLRLLRDIPVFNGDFVDHPSSSESFDAYCSFHVIEHVVNFQHHLDIARDRVKPGGLAFIATPNAGGWEQRLPFQLSPNNDSSHFQLFSARALENYLGAHGWEIIELRTPSYAIAWLRIFTKILRRLRGQDENATGGEYAKEVSPTAARAISAFRTFTAPLRKVQELLKGGNEVFLVARKI
ncbi:MAG: class I SAM-dependent methyltransferase [Sphingosinicella sp.]|nr:class I SAM-dependent methyltransferase [Sphingosinicella sp.]